MKGLKDKLYWRQSGNWHCFIKAERGLYESLCQTITLRRVGGQKCNRPKAYARCTQCDILEMKLRGWKESGPESIK